MARGFVLVFLFSSIALGQFVGGFVIDRKSSTPIARVRVVLLDQAGQKILADAAVDTSGMFLVEALRGGTYRLAVTRTGSVVGATDPFVVAHTE